jgi:hypothetical protein
MPLVENSFCIGARFLFVVAFCASYSSVTGDFMWAMTNVARGRTLFFAVVRIIRSMTVGAISRYRPRLFMRSMAIGTLFARVDIDSKVIALCFRMALLAFPSTFANKCSTNAGRIVATYAMQRAHTRDAYAYLVMTLHALPVDWFAKPFDFANVTTSACRTAQQHGVDIVADFLGDFFPPRCLSILVRMATTAPNGAWALVRQFINGRRWRRFHRPGVGGRIIVGQTASTGYDKRTCQEPFPTTRTS